MVVSCALNPAGPLARREEGCSPICGVLDISGTYAQPGAGADFDGAISRTPKFIVVFGVGGGWEMWVKERMVDGWILFFGSAEARLKIVKGEVLREWECMRIS